MMTTRKTMSKMHVMRIILIDLLANQHYKQDRQTDTCDTHLMASFPGQPG